MAKPKSKRKSKAKPKPRAVPRGMYLTVSMHDNQELENELRITGFGDIVALGHKVARAVREWVKRVPMERYVRPYTVTVAPSWTETAIPRKPEMVGVPGATVDELKEEP